MQIACTNKAPNEIILMRNKNSCTTGAMMRQSAGHMSTPAPAQKAWAFSTGEPSHLPDNPKEAPMRRRSVTRTMPAESAIPDRWSDSRMG